MRIFFPVASDIKVETSGHQMIRCEFFDEEGSPIVMLELSLQHAIDIADHLQENIRPSDLSASGWELK